jgi:hypothetical protein
LEMKKRRDTTKMDTRQRRSETENQWNWN